MKPLRRCLTSFFGDWKHIPLLLGLNALFCLAMPQICDKMLVDGVNPSSVPIIAAMVIAMANYYYFATLAIAQTYAAAVEVTPQAMTQLNPPAIVFELPDPTIVETSEEPAALVLLKTEPAKPVSYYPPRKSPLFYNVPYELYPISCVMTC